MSKQSKTRNENQITRRDDANGVFRLDMHQTVSGIVIVSGRAIGLCLNEIEIEIGICLFI